MTVLLILLLVYHLVVGLSMMFAGLRGSPLMVLHGAATVALVALAWLRFLA